MVSTPTTSADRRTNSRAVQRGEGVFLSRADFDALMREIESLRREAAGTRVPSGDAQHAAGADDLVASLEYAGVEHQRIEQVSTLLELASTLDDLATTNGGAGIGSIVRVVDRAGRESRYELVARPIPVDEPRRVAIGSPEAQALLGARPGEHVLITHGNGNRQRVRVVDVQPRATPLGAVLDA
jgi:transcription elongation GreA/GreB family factor